LTSLTTRNAQRHYTVAGMTCEHCVMSVREEVGEVAGVTSVDVALAAGRLAVTGTELDDQAIAAAVAEAGYEVTA
jgi:copper chaperone